MPEVTDMPGTARAVSLKHVCLLGLECPPGPCETPNVLGWPFYQPKGANASVVGGQDNFPRGGNGFCSPGAIHTTFCQKVRNSRWRGQALLCVNDTYVKMLISPPRKSKTNKKNMTLPVG